MEVMAYDVKQRGELTTELGFEYVKFRLAVVIIRYHNHSCPWDSANSEHVVLRSVPEDENREWF